MMELSSEDLSIARFLGVPESVSKSLSIDFSWNLILLCQVNWDDQLHTLPQGAGLPPPPHHQPQYPLQDHQPLCPPTDCQPQKNQWEPFCSDQGNACEERQSSMSQSLSPESPEISFLQPSFLSPTYQRPKNVAHGF